MQNKLAVKIALIAFIAIVLLVPITLISGKISERQHYRHEAENSIEKNWTGAQQIMSPVLVQGYEMVRPGKTIGEFNTQENPKPVEKRAHYIPLQAVQISADVSTSLRNKGIYAIPVYQADIAINGSIPTQTIQQQLAQIESSKGFVKFLPAYIALHISDARGVSGQPALTWKDKQYPIMPGSGLATLSSGLRSVLGEIYDQQDGAKRGPDTTQNVEVNLAFQLRGMSSLSFIPASLNTEIKMRANWPHPEFTGAFLPTAHNISSAGFSSEWEVNEFSSNVVDKLRACEKHLCEKLINLNFGTHLYQAVDVYLQTERSMKYAILFIAICFISFFLFEITRKTPIHPIQYTLVGLSLATFYLLLVSLSEHIDFLYAYTLSTLACLGLLNIYLGKVFGNVHASRLFCLALAGLYALLYVIIQMEDTALLMGSILLFSLLAVLMISTRTLDWYKLGNTQN